MTYEPSKILMGCSGEKCPLAGVCKRVGVEGIKNFTTPPFVFVDKIHVECDKFIDKNETVIQLFKKMGV